MGQENPAPETRGGVEFLPEKFSALRRKTEDRFVPLNNAPYEKQQQTFEIILPNLIHKSKKRNLKNS